MVGQQTLDLAPRVELLSKFLKSRRQGLSPRTLKFYEGFLKHSGRVIGISVSGKDINDFLDFLQCTNGGKHSYFRTLRTFYNWLYSRKSGYNLNPQNNPILDVYPPKVEKRILPSLTEQQVETLISQVECTRDKCIISLFADSGMRLTELANIQLKDIDWTTKTITVIGKGNKQRKAPFTSRTMKFFQQMQLGEGIIWGINKYGIQQMLERLEKKTNLKCNPHVFRRAFACNLHRKGLSTLTIMHLGGWESLDLVLRYTQSITFEDCLKHYEQVNN